MLDTLLHTHTPDLSSSYQLIQRTKIWKQEWKLSEKYTCSEDKNKERMPPQAWKKEVNKWNV